MITEASERSRPTGAQWTIRRGGDELVVVEFGGGIRGYTRGGIDVVAGYGPDEMSVAGRGQQLIPWPNRLRDGKYTHAGTERQLALTEPAKHNATHGLVRWTTWDLLDQTSTSITVGQRLHPQPGWAWVLELTTIYALADDGLTVTTTALNVGEGDAPYGYGAHPYLSIADTPVAEVVLEVPATTYLETDAERQLPVATHPVERSAYDFRAGRPIGDLALDTAFTDLARGADGRWAVTLTGLATGAVSLWGDEAYAWTQVFTGRAHPHTEGTTGIAVEPMTCPPDAFNSGTDLVVLRPEQSHTGSWGIRPA
ncbi:MAG TPA: aldose 1-epimerase family protein [Lapillicoccus sp.]|uniref:aldose 1-epimerase family protein n=1 Tax=Lapillicoccus sp. TaxID=1909287 RepID=UPI002F94BA3F